MKIYFDSDLPWSIRELKCVVTTLLSAMQFTTMGEPRNDAIGPWSQNPLFLSRLKRDTDFAVPLSQADLLRSAPKFYYWKGAP